MVRSSIWTSCIDSYQDSNRNTRPRSINWLLFRPRPRYDTAMRTALAAVFVLLGLAGVVAAEPLAIKIAYYTGTSAAADKTLELVWAKLGGSRKLAFGQIDEESQLEMLPVISLGKISGHDVELQLF